MSASITLKSRFDNLEEYIKRNFVDNVMHVFSGRSYEWENEVSPDVVYSDQKSELDTRHSMIYLKKVIKDDTSKAIKRFDWKTGFVYKQSDCDSEYTDIRTWEHPSNPFYVINSEGNVYKCISNNYGTVSTSEPTGQSFDLTLTADGYIWKFMFDISVDIRDKFLTDNWVPVPEETHKTAVHDNVIAGAIDGGIQFIRVDLQGKGYSGTPNVEIEGDGSGCMATAITNAGVITHIAVTDPGTGYTFATINIYSTNGSGAKASAMISPPGGHGFDAVNELGAFFLTVSVEFQGDTDGYPAWSTYRQIGMIRNILDKNSDPIIDDNITSLNTINIEFASGTYNTNEKVIGEDSESYGYVYYDEVGDSTSIHLYNVHGTFIDGEIIHGQGSEVNATFRDVGTTYNTIDLTKGDLMYRENIRFITRNSLQIEKFVFTIEF